MPAEQYLEYLRLMEYSPNTVRSYARSLALWWSFLEHRSVSWDDVRLEHFGQYLHALRTGTVESGVTHIADASPRAPMSTVATRVRAVMSMYRYHAANGVRVSSDLYDVVQRRPGPYLPFFEHLAAKSGFVRSRVRLTVPNKRPPVLSPAQITALLDHEATWDVRTQEWTGDLRYRLLWSLLAETGARIGEALSLRHGDWNPGRGGTASVSFEPSEHPHDQRLKSGPRVVHIGSRLDRLYGDYVWWLCERGADLHLKDWGSSYVFVNVFREPMFAPMRTESIYGHLRSVKAAGIGLPQAMSPHWFRHTHATALLLSGTPPHVVSRRLGHKDVQTTQRKYAHVTEDAELAALGNWTALTDGWAGAA
jgi:site-specific recombinase XerD